MADFVASLPPADRERLLALGIPRRYPGGQAIVHEHDDAGGVLVVLSGEIAVTTLGPGGKELLLGIAGPGELVGEVAALRGGRRTSTLAARTDVETIAIPAAAFRAFVVATPAAAASVIDGLLDRLDRADEQRRELAALDVVGRVARRVLELDARGGTAVTHDELAAWAGASREAVTKALAQLRGLGALETGRGHVRVLDADALRRRAGV